MDINRLSRGEQIVGVSGVVLLISSFFTWFSAEAAGSGIEIPNASASGWNGGLAIFGLLLAIGLVVYVGLKAADVALPNTNWRLIVLIVGVVVLLCIVGKFVAGVSLEGPGGVEIPDDVYDVSRKVPAWIGLVAAVLLAVGKLLNFRESQSSTGGTRPPAGGPTV